MRWTESNCGGQETLHSLTNAHREKGQLIGLNKKEDDFLCKIAS